MEQQRPVVSRPMIIAASLLGVVIIGLVLYIYGIRPQDSDYDAARQQVDAMVSKADQFKQLADDPTFGPSTVTDSQLTTAKQLAADYNSALTSVDKSPAVTRDGKVNDVYTSIKKQLSDYGQGTQDLVTTLAATALIKQNCNMLLSEVSTIKTVAALNTASQNCRDSLNANQTVPLQDFNDTYFVPYRKDVSDIIKALNGYYTAGAAGAATAQQQAQKDLDTAIATVGTLNAKGYSMTNATTSPKSALSKLQTVLNQQKSTFIR